MVFTLIYIIFELERIWFKFVTRSVISICRRAVSGCRISGYFTVTFPGSDINMTTIIEDYRKKCKQSTRISGRPVVCLEMSVPSIAMRDFAQMKTGLTETRPLSKKTWSIEGLYETNCSKCSVWRWVNIVSYRLGSPGWNNGKTKPFTWLVIRRQSSFSISINNSIRNASGVVIWRKMLRI